MQLEEIKNRYTGEVIFKIEIGSFKLAVEAAVKQKANLYGADLRGADLRRADLWRTKGIIRIEGAIPYTVLLTKTHVMVGCKYFTWEECRDSSQEDIAKLDNEETAKHFPKLLKLMDIFENDLRGSDD